MTRSIQFPSIALALSGLAVVAASAFAAPEAQARERTSTASGPQGHSATRSATRSEGNVSSSTVNNQTGGTIASRQVDRSKAGTQGAVKGPGGNTSTRSSTPNGSGGADTTVTGPAGRSGSKDTTRSR